jgi:hypothetical protein
MKLRRFAATLWQDSSGIALTEFAFAFPILLALAMYGIDTANFALTHLRLNQIALNLADNASRVGASSTLSTQQMREVDVADVFQAAKIHGEGINLEDNSWVTLSSLEKDSSGRQRIHWQRCFGNKTDVSYKSNYGRVLNTDGAAKDVDTNGNGTIDDSEMKGQRADNGLGDATVAAVNRVNAPTNTSGVMFVEINYRYTPMFPWLSAPADLRYTASFIVRDPRDFDLIYATTGTTPSYCNYTTRAAPPPVP